jgi:hypothetical protein
MPIPFIDIQSIYFPLVCCLDGVDLPDYNQKQRVRAMDISGITPVQDRLGIARNFVLQTASRRFGDGCSHRKPILTEPMEANLNGEDLAATVSFENCRESGLKQAAFPHGDINSC